MKYLHAFGAPAGVVVGVVSGPDAEQFAWAGRGRCTIALRREVGDVPEFSVRARFFTLLPGVFLIWANQRHKV